MKHLALLSILFIGLAGCSATKTSPVKNPQAYSRHSVSALNLQALQPLEKITPMLKKHRVVFVGEQHDQYADHLNQLSVIKSLHQYWGKQTSIGLEMIQQPYQSYLDDYISGKISEREMLKNVEWYERWRFDFRLYRPIFDYAKANKIPLIALNIPKELTRSITKVGIKGLTKKQRAQLPSTIDRSDNAYTKRITDIFSRHSHTRSKGVEKFLDAQLAWDEGMAYSATKFLTKNPNMHMVVLAGGGHVINRSGIPNRLDRQIQSKSAIVLNNIHDIPSAKQGDYLLFSPEIALPEAGKIGIAMGKGKGGVLIKALSPHGAAFKAGIKKGDTIIKIDGETIKHQSDILLWGLDKKPNDKATISLLRNNKVITKTLKLKGKTSTPLH